MLAKIEWSLMAGAAVAAAMVAALLVGTAVAADMSGGSGEATKFPRKWQCHESWHNVWRLRVSRDGLVVTANKQWSGKRVVMTYSDETDNLIIWGAADGAGCFSNTGPCAEGGYSDEGEPRMTLVPDRFADPIACRPR